MANYITGRNLLSLPDKTWFWSGYIPNGELTLMAGDPGTGKSAMALDLGKRWSEGTEFPDGTPILNNPTKSPFVWLDAEGSKPIVKERILKYGINPDKIILPNQGDIYADFVINTKTLEQVHSIIKETTPGIIIVDSLSGVNYGEENDRRQMKNILKLFQDLASRNNIPVLIIHHLNKPSQNEFSMKVTLSRIRGSTQIAASVRSILAIQSISKSFPGQESEGKITSELVQIKNNLGKLNDNSIPFSINDNGVIYSKPYQDGHFSKENYRQEEKAQALINQILKENDGKIKAKEIEEILNKSGISESTWKRAKKGMPIKSTKEGNEWYWETIS